MIPRRSIGRHALLALMSIALLFAIFGTWRDRASAQAEMQCPAWHSKLDQSIHQSLHRDTDDRVSVIIRASSTSRRLWRQALKEHGDEVRSDLTGVGAFGAEVHLDDLSVLASDPFVRSISLDSIVAAH